MVSWVKKLPAIELCDDAGPLREKHQAAQAQVEQRLVFSVSSRSLFESGGDFIAVPGCMKKYRMPTPANNCYLANSLVYLMCSSLIRATWGSMLALKRRSKVFQT